MTLWNIIRDWFVQYIWGGTLSNGNFVSTNIIGTIYSYENNEYYEEYVASSQDLFIFHSNWGSNLTDYLTLSDWFSTTSTIICLTLLVVACIYFLIWLFRFVSGLYLLRS